MIIYTYLNLIWALSLGSISGPMVHMGAGYYRHIGGYKPGMLLNILQCTGHPAQNVNSAKVAKPRGSWHTNLHFQKRRLG